MRLPGHRDREAGRSHQVAQPPIVLRECYAMSGTEFHRTTRVLRRVRKAMQSCWIHLAYMGALCAGAARQVCTPTRILHFFKLCERIFEGLLLLAMIAVQICVAYHNVGNWYEADPPPGQFPT
eukprot:386374-Rhodomonas_salina.3